MNEWQLEALQEKGFEVEIKPLARCMYRVKVYWRGKKAMDVVRGSYAAAVRVPYYSFIEPEQQVIDRLKKRWQIRVAQIHQEMRQ